MNWRDLERGLASCASTSTNRRPRLRTEEDDDRSPYVHDRDRIVHSASFRRLQHKTQVFVVHEGDFFRTRLTHTLEVVQISRSLAAALNVNQDLAEAIALGHDLGHAPFGHAGEACLSELLKNPPDVRNPDYGKVNDAPVLVHGIGDENGFDHNTQSFRVVHSLEASYPDRKGLNPTWETCEGLLRHETRHDGAPRIWPDYYVGDHPSVEAQVCNVADSIAYGSHDLDDGLAAGFITWDEILDCLSKKLGEGTLLQESYTQADSHVHEHALGDKLEEQRLTRKAAVREFLSRVISDAETYSRELLADANPRTPDDARMAKNALVQLSPAVARELSAVGDFLFERMYRDFRVVRMDAKGARIIRDLFTAFAQDIDLLHPMTLRHYQQAESAGQSTTRVLADYVSGMTDRHAMELHSQLFGTHDRAMTQL